MISPCPLSPLTKRVYINTEKKGANALGNNKILSSSPDE